MPDVVETMNMESAVQEFNPSAANVGKDTVQLTVSVRLEIQRKRVEEKLKYFDEIKQVKAPGTIKYPVIPVECLEIWSL